MPFNSKSYLQAEVTSEPDSWSAVIARLPELAPSLPATGDRVAVVGCGTSYFMALAYAALREEAGQGETDAFSASEFPLGRHYDAVVVISRSGTTTEVIDLLDSLRGSTTRTIGIVATAGTAVTTMVDDTILLSEVDEQSVVQTRFATSTLALLRASLGEDLSEAIADARAVLAEDEAQALGGLAEVEQVTFVGKGWTVGLAMEAGLKLRESAQFWTESYPAMEYRHGPIAIAAPGRAVWAFGEVPDGLPEQVQATGARFESRTVDPLADLVRVHRLCLLKARLLDLDPDNPRNLTRSVILSSASQA